MAFVAAAGMVASLAPSAQAAFTTAPCGGVPVNGRGASFQAGAQAGFNTYFHSTGAGACGAGGPGISYDAAGSTPGRQAFGETTRMRDPSVRYIAFDEAPTPGQRGDIELGGAGTNDDGKLHVIPVAVGSIPIIVNFPDGCTIPDALKDSADPTPSNDVTENTQRFLAGTPTTVNVTWEKAWAGEITTWNDLVPGITPAGCATKPIKRIVRSSGSGTTFAFKKWLQGVNDSVGGTHAWGEPGLPNTSWLSVNGSATPVQKPVGSGNGPLAELVKTTDGSIGYGDLKTDRDAGFSKTKCTSGSTGCPDDTFWVRVRSGSNGSGILQDPQKEILGYKDGTVAKGANCDQAAIAGTPGGSDPTLGDWSGVSAVASTNGYAICAPTYMGVWDDASTVYCNAQAEQDKFRTVVDYVRSITTTGGQNTLSTTDYNRLPAGLLNNAQTGVNALDWAKTGGSACPAPPPGGGGGTTSPPSGGAGSTTPPLSTPTASLAIASASVAKDATVTISSRVSGAGTLSGAETASVSSKDAKSAKKKKAKNTTLTVAKVSLRVLRAGTYKLVFKPSAKAKRILAKRHKLKVSIKVTFTPASGGGNPVTKTVTLTIKAKKKK